MKPILVIVGYQLEKLDWKISSIEKVIELRMMIWVDVCSCVKRTLVSPMAQRKSNKNTLMRFILPTNEEKRKFLLLRTMMTSFGGHMNGSSRLDPSTTSVMRVLRQLRRASTRPTGASSRTRFELHLIKSRS